MAKKKIDNEIFKTLIEDYNIKDTNDIKDMLKDLLSGTIQTMLEAEIEHELGYAKHSMKDKITSNARNGHSKKTVRSEYGNIDLDIPKIEMLSLSFKSSLNEISISKLKGSNKEMDWKNTRLGRNIFSVKYLF